ncbi:MAG: transposase family protein [Betaproteobacteria bacterium]|nr:transposase family protein [Betaproteobacteria bacterium]
MTLLRYAPRRVDCAKCGVHVEAVPWAAPESRCTRRMEELVAYLAQQMSKTAVCKLASWQASTGAPWGPSSSAASARSWTRPGSTT